MNREQRRLLQSRITFQLVVEVECNGREFFQISLACQSTISNVVEATDKDKLKLLLKVEMRTHGNSRLEAIDPRDLN